jgi:hypothetical protein
MDSRLYLVSFVYTNDGGGNTQFGDFSQSYTEFVFMTHAEAAKVVDILRSAFEQGEIIDANVSEVPPEADGASFDDVRAALGHCLHTPDIETLL